MKQNLCIFFFVIGRVECTLEIDRNFILSILQIQSQLSTLLVGIIQLNEYLERYTTI